MKYFYLTCRTRKRVDAAMITAVTMMDFEQKKYLMMLRG